MSREHADEPEPEPAGEPAQAHEREPAAEPADEPAGGQTHEPEPVPPPEPEPEPEPVPPPEPEPEPADLGLGPLALQHLEGLVEALVFASDTPLTAAEIARAAKADRKLVRETLARLVRHHADRGVQLCEIAGGFAFRTAPAFAPFVRDAAARKPARLTRAQLETLAIVAYRQPVTRPEIDDVRGVDSGPVLKTLLERELLRILGKRDEPGRPLVYGTTPKFLELFSLKALRDLPTLKEFTELSDDSRRLYERELGEPVPEGAPEAPADDLDLSGGGDAEGAATDGAPGAEPGTEPE